MRTTMFKRNLRQLTVHSLVFAFVLLVTHHSSLITVFAASATRTLSGTVEDEKGAVIPDVNITVTNKATGQKRDAVTNKDGYLTVTLLPPSTYTVRVERENFNPVEISNVVLNVGDQKALQVQLKVGNVNATVQVTNEAELIKTDAAVGTVVDRQFVANIPLNGRSFQSLITLTPGIVVTPAASASQGVLGQFSVNGQRASANSFTVDGVSANF